MSIPNPMTAMLADRAATVHADLLTAAREPDAEQFARWLAPNVPSVAWHLWHVARWADRVQTILPGVLGERRTPSEIWEVESLAARWALDSTALGYGQTGMEMGDDAASTMRLPDRDTLADYAQRAFAGAEAMFRSIGDVRLSTRGPDLLYAGRLNRERSVGESVIGHVSHLSRHLGTIEGLRALLLQKPGSITF